MIKTDPGAGRIGPVLSNDTRAHQLDDASAATQACRMTSSIPSRRRSASAPFVPERLPASARDRILLALELGRRGQVLRKLGQDAKSGRDSRTR